MEHIKLFEGYFDQPSYEEISGDDYRIMLHTKEPVDIKSRIGKSIKKRFNSEIKSEEFRTGRSSIKYNNGKFDPGSSYLVGARQLVASLYGVERKETYENIRGIIIAYPENRWHTFIWEIQDEWFLVYDQEKYYKCDGTDGLMDLLKEMGMIE
jgi:hypothetical protein